MDNLDFHDIFRGYILFIKNKILILLFSIILVSCSAKYDTEDMSGKVAAIDPAGQYKSIISHDDQFVTYENGVIHDINSTLEWYSGDVTKLSRTGTRLWISNLNAGGAGWRLPTRDELFILNKRARKICKTLRLTRDYFWIKNYRIYNLITHIESSPLIIRHRSFFLQRGRRSDEPSAPRAHIIVVRDRK